MKPSVKMAVMARQMDEKRQMNEPRDNYRRFENNGARMDYGGARSEHDEMRGNYPRSNYNDMRGNYDNPRGEGGRADMREYARFESNNPNTNYGDTEARFRDRRGREHYDNGRYAPRNEMEEPEGNGEPESRRYRRYDDGRFAPRSADGVSPFVPPIYREGGADMNRIGFAREQEMDNRYPMDASYPRMNEAEHRTSHTQMGRAEGAKGMKMDKEMAERWTKGMKNEDGSKGPHWTLDQAKQVMQQHNLSYDPYEFWAVLCAVYSDYSAVAKKHNANNIGFYIDMTKAWLDDKDAVEDKAAAYFCYVVEQDR